VADALPPGLVDDLADRLVDADRGVVVAAHHHEHLAELAGERPHRRDHVLGPVALAADAGRLDRAPARLGAEHEVVPLECAVVGVPPDAAQRGVADQPDVRCVSGVVVAHRLVGTDRRAEGDGGAEAEREGDRSAPAPTRRGRAGTGTDGHRSDSSYSRSCTARTRVPVTDLT
jgi:hypothetical protein